VPSQPSTRPRGRSLHRPAAGQRNWRLALASLLLFIGGCSELGYYAQAINGHLELMGERQSVQALLDAPATPAELRDHLQLSTELLQFAHTRMQLPDNGSYRSYVHIDGPYVVWNVFAAPPLSLDALQWCVPLVVGCTVYRGWFEPARATEQAQQLQQQGYDTFVGGVTAYSTLGWFSDPLASTFFKHAEWRTAALLFHELAHQQLYIAGDSAFNESFATTVEREATRRWLQHQGTAETLAQAQEFWRKQDQNSQRIATARQQLQLIYVGDGSETTQLAAKQVIFDRLRADIGWGTASESPLNNATLAAMAAYTTLVPAFQALLRQQQDSITDFYQAAERIGKQPEAQRSETLRLLSDTASG